MDFNNYEELSSISLEDVKVFFSYPTFNTLFNIYNIRTIGDLFFMESNGELEKTIYKRAYRKEERSEMLRGTINVLRCKYLGSNPLIDENTTVDYFPEKLGISYLDCLRLKERGVQTFGQLMEIIRNNDFVKLYSLPTWGEVKLNTFLEKIRIVDNYNKYKKNHSDAKQVSQEQSIYITSEIINSYNELKRLIIEKNTLEEQIRILQSDIDNKMIQLRMVKK